MTKMSQLRVLLVGASVAGPTAAYWFSRAGAQVTIIERYPTFRTGGQAIDIRTAGVTVMRRMPGMEAAVRAKTTTLEGMSFVDTHGRPYGTLVATGNPDQQSLVSEYEIFRGDLAEIVYDMTREDKNIRYVFGEQVASIRQGEKEDGPVTVEFMNGKLEAQDYDLVVACDGATSRTRALGFGCGVRDHIIPINAWACYSTMKNDLLQGKKVGLAHNIVGGKFVAIGPEPTGKTTVCFIRVHREGGDATLPFREAAKQGDDALKQYIAKELAGGGWKMEEIIQGILKAEDCYASEIVQVKPPSLYKGRFALVGDAGYGPGPTGGGTSLALTGAYVLAGEIAKHKGDLSAGLQGYERTMRPIITDLQKIPPGVFTIMAPQTEWGIWIRNTLFGLVTRSGLVAFFSKYFANAFGEADKYKLEQYPWGR